MHVITLLFRIKMLVNVLDSYVSGIPLHPFAVQKYVPLADFQTALQ